MEVLYSNDFFCCELMIRNGASALQEDGHKHKIGIVDTWSGGRVIGGLEHEKQML